MIINRCHITLTIKRHRTLLADAIIVGKGSTSSLCHLNRLLQYTNFIVPVLCILWQGNITSMLLLSVEIHLCKLFIQMLILAYTLYTVFHPTDVPTNDLPLAIKLLMVNILLQSCYSRYFHSHNFTIKPENLAPNV